MDRDREKEQCNTETMESRPPQYYQRDILVHECVDIVAPEIPVVDRVRHDKNLSKLLSTLGVRLLED